MFDISADLDYLIQSMGKQVKVNSKDCKAIISDFDKLNSKYKIISKSELQTGDIVEVGNTKYIIISDVGFKDFYYKAIMQKVNHNVKFNFAGQVKQFDAIIETKVFDTTTERYFELVDNEILIILQHNSDTGKIQLNQRFIKFNNAWKVKSINKVQKGLVILTCESDLINQNDDVVNEIANRWDYEQKYTITIINKPSSLYIGDTIQLQVQVKDSNNQVVSKTLQFTSSDSAVATINETGLITAVGVGTVTITVSLVDDTSIKDTFTLEVKQQVQQHSYTATLSGNDTITKGLTRTYTAKLYDFGVEVTGAQFNFSISDTTNAQITSTTNNTVTVKAINSGYTIVITATWTGDLNVKATKQVTTTSGF